MKKKISTAEQADWIAGMMESWLWVFIFFAHYSNIPSFQFYSLFLCVLCDLCG
jgi:hypothetical protein